MHVCGICCSVRSPERMLLYTCHDSNTETLLSQRHTVCVECWPRTLRCPTCRGRMSHPTPLSEAFPAATGEEVRDAADALRETSARWRLGRFLKLHVLPRLRRRRRRRQPALSPEQEALFIAELNSLTRRLRWHRYVETLRQPDAPLVLSTALKLTSEIVTHFGAHFCADGTTAVADIPGLPMDVGIELAKLIRQAAAAADE